MSAPAIISASPPSPQSAPRAVIFYDGECGLCDRSVQFILPRDPAGYFHFTALQSDWAKNKLAALGHPELATAFDTMVLLEEDQLHTRSSAALRILRRLRGWRWAYAFIVIPKPLRDFVYRCVARNRHRWFPAPPACGLPKPGWRERFLQ